MNLEPLPSPTTLENVFEVGFFLSDPANDDPLTYSTLRDTNGDGRFEETEGSAWIWMGRGFREMIQPQLGDGISEVNASVLLCPTDTGEVFDPRFERTSYSYSLAFYHSIEQLEALTTPLSIVSNPPPPVPQRVSSVLYPSAKVIAGDWDRYHDPELENRDPEAHWSTRGWWDVSGWWQHAFADGSAGVLRFGDAGQSYDGLKNPGLTIGGVRGRDRQR